MGEGEIERDINKNATRMPKPHAQPQNIQRTCWIENGDQARWLEYGVCTKRGGFDGAIFIFHCLIICR